MNKEFELAYGNSRAKFSISQDNLLGVIKPVNIVPLENPSVEVKRAIKNPIGSAPLTEIVSPGEKVCIVVSDKTRTAGTEIVVPIIIEELLKSGIFIEDILILFATGTHSQHTRKEQEAIVGPQIASRVMLLDHDCRDESNLKYIGYTNRGTRVIVNRQLIEFDRIILTGVITYHYFAGFGGGRKSILPGTAAFSSIEANHKLTMSPHPGEGMNEMARTCMLQGNPVHEDMEEAARMVSPDFLVNVVLDDHKDIAKVFAGDFIKAHQRGCDYLNKHYGVPIKEKADVVIVGCGGYPKDIDFVQSHKAMDNAAHALKESGIMVLVAEAAGGFTSPVYEKWYKLGSLEAIEASLRENFSIPGHTVYAAMEKAKKLKVIWLSQQDPKKVKEMGITPAASIKEALLMVEREIGNSWKAYVIPEGYVTFPSICGSCPPKA